MTAPMRVRIHRGAREIGGSCVEIEHDGRRLVLDIGRPLNGDPDAQVPLPAIDGLAGGDPSLVGVVISHPHLDHYGLVAGVHPSVPIYIGEAAGRILAEASFFTPAGVQLQPAGFLRDGATFDLGPFSVTPYLIDHSAFDSYTLLVEAGGKRLLYSGDVRGHGRKRALFERLVTNAPDRVDALLLEGTHVRGAEVAEQEIPSEAALEERCTELFAGTGGMVLACYSPQNVDRVVTLFRAAKRSGRLLVLDLYGATITHATGRTDTIPQADWSNVRVFAPLAQRLRIKRTGAFQRLARVGPHRIYPEQLGAQASRLVMTFRQSMAPELERAQCLSDASAVWSIWSGYLDQPAGTALRQWLEQRQIPLTVAHSSGHAKVRDLQRLATAVAARRVIPIHTGAPDRFPELFENVVLRQDGDWWPV